MNKNYVMSLIDLLGKKVDGFAETSANFMTLRKIIRVGARYSREKVGSKSTQGAFRTIATRLSFLYDKIK